MTEARFVYSVVASSLHDQQAVETLTAPVRALLDDLGGAVVGLVLATGHHEQRLRAWWSMAIAD